MKRIVVDIDDTLADFSGAFHQWMTKRYNRDFDWFGSYNLLDPFQEVLDPDVTSWDLLEQFHEGFGMDNLQPLEKICSAIRTFGAEDVVYITARGWLGPHAEELTSEWLSKHNLPNPNNVLVCTNERGAKIRELEAYSYKQNGGRHEDRRKVVHEVFEDNVDHIWSYRLSYALVGINVVDQSWNRNLPSSFGRWYPRA